MVGGEIDAHTGLPAYREVIVTVPRQSGKTTLVLAWEVQRSIGWTHLGPQRTAYSAQTGNDARKKLIEDQVPLLEPRKKVLGIRRILRGMGNEAVEFVTGSRIVLLASAEDSGHGKTIDLGVKDEFFADYDDRRDQALVPAMATRKFAQVLTTSTMGTEESVPLNRTVQRGRRAVEAGKRSGIAYFEWSASEDADADDPGVWRRCMPALGLTISEEVVRHARDTLPDGEFRRAFLNVPTKAEDRVIPGPVWDLVNSPVAKPGDPVVFAIDCNPERSAAALGVSDMLEVPTAELIAHQAGVGWLVDKTVEVSKRAGDRPVAVDMGGPAASFVPELERRGVTVIKAQTREVVEATAGFFDRVIEQRIKVRRHPALDTAVAAAAKRQVGDAWLWARKSTQADVCPLVGITLAVWGASAAEEPVPEPFMVVTTM